MQNLKKLQGKARLNNKSMKFNNKMECVICGAIVAGIMITESGLCHQCEELPKHTSEAPIQWTDTNGFTQHFVSGGPSSIFSYRSTGQFS